MQDKITADLEIEIARLRAELLQQQREMDAAKDVMSHLREESERARAAAQQENDRLAAKTSEVECLEMQLQQYRHGWCYAQVV